MWFLTHVWRAVPNHAPGDNCVEDHSRTILALFCSNDEYYNLISVQKWPKWRLEETGKANSIVSNTAGLSLRDIQYITLVTLVKQKRTHAVWVKGNHCLLSVIPIHVETYTVTHMLSEPVTQHIMAQINLNHLKMPCVTCGFYPIEYHLIFWPAWFIFDWCINLCTHLWTE